MAQQVGERPDILTLILFLSRSLACDDVCGRRLVWVAEAELDRVWIACKIAGRTASSIASASRQMMS